MGSRKLDNEWGGLYITCIGSEFGKRFGKQFGEGFVVQLGGHEKMMASFLNILGT